MQKRAILLDVARPPLRLIAEEAGVSEPTVSRVLNGRAGVASATHARVTAVLRRHGFDNVPAPGSDRSTTIGIVCSDFLNPVFPTFVHMVSAELGRRGYVAQTALADADLVTEERCIEELTRSGVRSLIFIGGRHAETAGQIGHYRQLADDGVSMVFVNGRELDLDVPQIYCDEEAGARMATRHLVELGHTAIGCLLGPRAYIPTVRFIAGYRAVLAEHGLHELPGAVAEVPFTIEGGRAGAARLLELGCTAAIAGNDLMALGGLLASIGDSGTPLSVVGYDGTNFTAHTHPPLTTLRQPFEEMSHLIAEAIIAETNRSTNCRDRFVFEPRLIVRGSTSRPRSAFSKPAV